MKKYWSVFKISFQQEFVYRLNFIMWRVRNIMQIFLVFFLWDAVFSNPNRVVFGYDRAKILTYVFGLLIVRAFVLSTRAVDVAGEISSGDLSNYLIKPVSYFRYWLTRDISSKSLNLFFAVAEAILLYFLLKPPFFVQANLWYLTGFIASLVLAMLIFFVLLFLTSTIPFWMPESAWGAQFLVIAIITEFLSGALFPLDVLPSVVQNVLSFTPFPYLIFFPLQVYLGKIDTLAIIKGLSISLFWAVALWFILKAVWSRGLKVYQAHGR
jgi:ABC-2 type transport system permease protein